MYAIIPQQIPQGMRAEVNEKILFAIDSGKDLIPAESIYNCYTGIGGLHNLKQSDFASYHEYAEAKKEFEMGQFFTPHEICRDMVDMLCPVSSEMVLDMCCGMGNFFNHLPNPHNAYGFDIDGKAVSVARYLYPEAHIEKCDIRQYYPEQRFDVIIGNPPFNLKFDYKLSQEYYMDKAYDVLNPAGILMVIVPCSFMQSEFWEKTRITGINGNFSFVGQTKLAPSAFAAVGVHDFNTKIMVFLRKSGHIEMQAYNAEEFITADELKKRIGEARAMKHRLRFDLMRETNRIDKEELELFEYKLAKYLYELKAHAKLNKHIDKAEALVTKFRNQKPPENATREQVEQWEKNKLTPKKVLAVIRRYITSQNTVPRKEVALVKTSYGFKLKQYAPRLLDKVPHKAASINDLVLERTELRMPEVPTEKNMNMIPYDMLLLFVLLLLKAYPYHNLHKEISHIENGRLFRLLAICFCGCGYNSTWFLLRLSQDMLLHSCRLTLVPDLFYNPVLCTGQVQMHPFLAHPMKSLPEMELPQIHFRL